MGNTAKTTYVSASRPLELEQRSFEEQLVAFISTLSLNDDYCERCAVENRVDTGLAWQYRVGMSVFSGSLFWSYSDNRYGYPSDRVLLYLCDKNYTADFTSN